MTTTQPQLETVWTPQDADRIMAEILSRAAARRSKQASKNSNHRTAMLARILSEGKIK